jgi:peptide chain release factor 3
MRSASSARGAWSACSHDLELLEVAGHPFDRDAVLRGELSPVFFGSALTNFGVEPFLREFLELAPPPRPAGVARGRSTRRTSASPASSSRSRRTWIRGTATASPSCASARVASRPGWTWATCARGSDPPQRAAAVPGPRAHGDRGGVAGDVIGILDRGTCASATRWRGGGARVSRHSPLRPRALRARGPGRSDQAQAARRRAAPADRGGGRAGLLHLADRHGSGPTPLVGAVGMLQFDVLLHRLEHEYGVRCRLERPARARGGAPGADRRRARANRVRQVRPLCAVRARHPLRPADGVSGSSVVRDLRGAGVATGARRVVVSRVGSRTRFLARPTAAASPPPW